MLRRIYAVEGTVIPAGQAINVPVTMALSSLRQTSDDWAVEPRSLGIRILAARTLMRDEGRRSAVQVMNVCDSDFVLCQGDFIGKPVTTMDNVERKPRALEGEEVLSKEATVSVERAVPELNLGERCADAHIQVVIDDLPPELDLDQQTAAKKYSYVTELGCFRSRITLSGEQTWFNM